MGNCIRRGRHEVGEDDENEIKREYNQEQEEEGFGKERGKKIKIVLTKEELDWLMFELKSNKGTKLEHVLQQIETEREREASTVWKPSLESIAECPE